MVLWLNLNWNIKNISWDFRILYPERTITSNNVHVSLINNNTAMLFLLPFLFAYISLCLHGELFMSEIMLTTISVQRTLVSSGNF